MAIPTNGPQYPPHGFTPPVPPKKKRNPLLVGCLGCGGLLVVLFVIVGIVSAVTGGGTGTTAAPPPAIPSSHVASSGGIPTKAPAPPAQAKARTVLTESGNGIKSTRTFSVTGDWDLYYSFDCANFGSAGNFAVSGNSGGDVYVNALAKSGKDVTHQHNGPGSMALDVSSECTWKIKVVQLP